MFISIKKAISIVISMALIITSFLADFNIKVYALSDISELQPYSNYGQSTMGLSGKDISNIDLRDKLELVKTQTFDTHTIWPAKNRMPENFDQQKVLEWGKYPGLGIRNLHETGHTGKGVNIAYVDQPLLESHNEYKDRNIIYTKIRPDVTGMNKSMHGPAVLSILAGKDTGVAPESTVYFFGHPAWLADQNTHAESLRKLIEINKSLPNYKKVRIVGFSDGPDVRENNIEEYKKAIMEAEENDIMVIDVLSSLNIRPLEVKYPNDKDKVTNYEVAQWLKSSKEETNAFFVPTSGVTTAAGHNNDVNQYVFWTNGGLSWAIPYIVGTIALGLQIDPKLSKEDAYRFLKQSQIPYYNGGIINPEGFVKLVKQNYDLKNNSKPYYFLLYNGNKISKNDKIAIENYATRLMADGSICVLKDVTNYSTAIDIYKLLKEQSELYKGKLKGIQIFGSSSDVPSFDIHFKVKMQNGIDDSGNFKSDMFYSNFDSDENALKNDFSIYKAFEEKLNVNFVPEWSVSRLPLSATEIAPFINKYYDYRINTKTNKNIPYISFSNPIFSSVTHSDDMGYFIKERLDKEFKFLSSSNYRLYGNKEGLYPVRTSVLGDFHKENLKAENEEGVAHFFINSHGQEDNIDKCIFINSKDLDKYKDRLRLSKEHNENKSVLELRMSFINKKNINEVLSKNYYTLTLWTCLNAYNLKNDTLVHEALANGKAIDSMAASSIISNNGVNNKASLEDMKKNNFYYFMYNFFKYVSQGNSRSDSFFYSKRDYAQEILRHTDLLGGGNYGFNMHNVLSYHYLGLLDIPESQNRGIIMLPEIDVYDEDVNRDDNIVTGHIYFQDNNMEYKSLDYRYYFPTKEYCVDYIGYSCDNNSFYIKLKYYSPNDNYLCLFLQGDAPGLKDFLENGTKKGENLVIAKFAFDELKSYTAGLAINIGDRNFIFIDKDKILGLIENE